jgi:hypothetical protein
MKARGVVLFVLALGASTAIAGEITVSRVQGDVQVRAGMQETWQPVKKGDELKPHDSILTGENATVVLLVRSAEGKNPAKISIPADVILDLSDIRTLTRDELILKLTMERVRSSSYDWKNSELQIPNATVVHGEKREEVGVVVDDASARLRMNGTKVLFQNGFFSTCALKGLSLMGRFPSLGETFENRYMVAESLERSDLRGEALHEYLSLSSMPGLTAEQQRLVRSGITRLRGEGGSGG